MEDFLFQGKYESILEKNEWIFVAKAGFGFPSYNTVSEGDSSSETVIVILV